MKTNYKDSIKKKLTSSQNLSEFEQESKEGWSKIDFENWEDINQKLEEQIDTIVATQNKVQKTTDNKRSFQLSYIVGFAAMILILLGLSVKFFWSDTPTDKIFNEYYHPLSGPEDTFRGESPQEEALEKEKQASQAYDDLDYSKSIDFYSELLKEYPNNAKYTLFLGLSYINDGKYDNAILIYNNYIPKGVQYEDDIQWYLALAHLKRGEIQTSRFILKTIYEDNDNYYSSTAKDLAMRLEQLK